MDDTSSVYPEMILTSFWPVSFSSFCGINYSVE